MNYLKILNQRKKKKWITQFPPPPENVASVEYKSYKICDYLYIHTFIIKNAHVSNFGENNIHGL